MFFPQWEELNAAKPADGEEDPELLEEIAEARKNLGQFTRKTSPEYEPEGPPARAEEQGGYSIDYKQHV